MPGERVAFFLSSKSVRALADHRLTCFSVFDTFPFDIYSEKKPHKKILQNITIYSDCTLAAMLHLLRFTYTQFSSPFSHSSSLMGLIQFDLFISRCNALWCIGMAKPFSNKNISYRFTFPKWSWRSTVVAHSRFNKNVFISWRFDNGLRCTGRKTIRDIAWNYIKMCMATSITRRAHWQHRRARLLLFCFQPVIWYKWELVW